MKVSQHFEGIHGEWIEFQSTKNLGMENIEHWKQDSLFLRHTPDLPYGIFDEFLRDGWWLGFNQLDHIRATKLANKLLGNKDIEKLAHWILAYSKDDTYLNILGI